MASSSASAASASTSAASAASAAVSAVSAASAASASSGEPEPVITSQQKYTDALHRYYKYKSKYEQGISAKKATIKKTPVSVKEKRAMFHKFVPACVSCGRNVGSTFATVATQSDVTHTAKCGDTKNPCQLDMELKSDHAFDIRKDRAEEIETINVYGEQIIKLTNDGMFGYITSDEVYDRHEAYEQERVQLDAIRKKLKENHGFMGELDATYALVADNKNKQRKLHERNDLLNEHVAIIKAGVIEYTRTGNRQMLRDNVHLYVHEMRANIDMINHNKYAHMDVEYIPKLKEYVLRQDIAAPSSWLLDDLDPEVTRFFIGKKLTYPVNNNKGDKGARNTELAPSAIPRIDSETEFDTLNSSSSSYHPISSENLNAPNSSSSSYHPISSENLNAPNSSSSSYHPALSGSIATPPYPSSGNTYKAQTPPYTPPPYTSSSNDDEDEDEDEEDGEEDLPRLNIGSLIDSSSDDGAVPPPPPPLNEMSTSSSSGVAPPPPPSDQIDSSSSK